MTWLLLILPGLALGLTLHWTGLDRPAAVRDVLALRRSYPRRSALYALGFAMLLTAFLCWLAVIDVDTIEVLPLSGGVLLGGVIFGAAAGVCGFLPTALPAALGGGPFTEALCACGGFLTASLLLPRLSGLTAWLGQLPPLSAGTLFRVTLDEPFLLEGGFLGQGLTGLLLMTTAICLPGPRRQQAAEPAADPPVAAEGEVFVAQLPGEEPLVTELAPEEDDPLQDELTALDALEEEPEDALLDSE